MDTGSNYSVILKQQAASAIKTAMRRHGITKAWLARSLNVSRANITQLLAGDTNLTLESIAIIARALGHEPQIKLIDTTSVQPDSVGRIKAALVALGNCNVLQPDFSAKWEALKTAVINAGKE